MIYIALLTVIFVFGLLLLGEDPGNRRKIAFLFTAWLLMTLISGFRGSTVGNDTSTYIYRYAEASSLSLPDLIAGTRHGVGYLLLEKFCLVFSSNPNSLFIVCAGITNGLVVYFIYKNSKDVFFPVFLYFVLDLYFFALSGIRQALAMSICLLAVEFMKKKRFLPFAAAVIAASLFHVSALCLLPFYLIAYRKIDLKNLCYTVIFALGGLLFINFAIMAANTLFGMSYIKRGYPIGGVVPVTIMLITLAFSFLYSKQLEKEPDFNLLVNIAMIALIFYLARYYQQAAERLSLYFQFGLLILIPKLFKSIEDKRTRKVLYAIALAAGFLLVAKRCINENYLFFWSEL